MSTSAIRAIGTGLAAPAGAPGTAGTTAAGEWYGARHAQVVAFLDRLRRVPLDAWMRAVESEVRQSVGSRADAPDEPMGLRILQEELADQAAREHLHDAMDSMPRVLARIRRRVDDESTVLDGLVSSATAGRMRRAARLAACALAARPLLPPRDFDRLYKPFAALIPPSQLASR